MNEKAREGMFKFELSREHTVRWRLVQDTGSLWGVLLRSTASEEGKEA